jgi:hypothetical protein
MTKSESAIYNYSFSFANYMRTDTEPLLLSNIESANYNLLRVCLDGVE